MPLNGSRKLSRHARLRVKTFSENATAEMRALQIYPILVGLALRRQTITYKKLAELMGYAVDGARGFQFLGPFLGYVLAWCAERDLPLLNFLVVNQRDGVPSFTSGYGAEDVPGMWQRIFEERWYEYCPPSTGELRSARQWAVKRNWKLV